MKQSPKEASRCRGCGTEIKYNVYSECCSACFSRFKIYNHRIKRLAAKLERGGDWS